MKSTDPHNASLSLSVPAWAGNISRLSPRCRGHFLGGLHFLARGVQMACAGLAGRLFHERRMPC